MDIYFFLFDQFQTLDVFGPIEILGRIKGVRSHFCSINGGVIYSCHQVPIVTEQLPQFLSDKNFIFFIPGGMETRDLVHNPQLIFRLKYYSEHATYCLTVCTGSALLVQTGLLDGRQATSNKVAWSWVTSINTQVRWQRTARWCKDDKFYTSSGISAGMDMALGFIADRYGHEYADQIAMNMEYKWNDDCHYDPFAVKLTNI